MITVRTKRPTYLTTTTSGVFAFCIAIPTDLRAPGTAVIVQRSLRTRRRAQARALAKRIAFECLVLFDAAREAETDGVGFKTRLPNAIRSIVDDALRSSVPAVSVVPTVEHEVAAFRAEIDAMWSAPLIAPPTPEPEHSCTHVLLFNDASEPAYRRRFAAFEHGPVQQHRIRRWTVLRHVPSPEHSSLARRLGRPVWFGDYFDSL